jgi:putative copper resistance protein D
MPAFGDQLSAESRWDLVNFVRTLTVAEEARSLTEVPDASRPRIAAPDFIFSEGAAPHRLSDFRGRQTVLLVLIASALSQARLAQLARAHDELAAANVRIIAVPLDSATAPPRSGTVSTPFPIVSQGAEAIATTYRLFASPPAVAAGPPGKPSPRHAEFLIDRSGYLRARWIQGSSARGWDDLSVLLSAIRVLSREPDSSAPGQYIR